MRKLVLLLFVVLSCLPAFSRLEYLPSYFTKVAIADGTFAIADSSTIDELSVSASNNRYTISVVHDSITQEILDKISYNKMSKFFSGLAMSLEAVSTMYSLTHIPKTLASAMFQTQMVITGIGIISNASILHFIAENNIEELKKLPISIVISNNTEREMCVNDMSRGLTWYISPLGTLSLRVGNPEINQFRLAYADTTEPQVSYIMIQAVNCIDNYDVMYENEDVWILSSNRDGYNIKYHIKDKDKLLNRTISEDIAYQMINTLKKKDKKK